jgi:hypothetical protein
MFSVKAYERVKLIVKKINFIEAKDCPLLSSVL